MQLLTKSLVPLDFRKGMRVYGEGSRNTHVYFVRSGSFTIYKKVLCPQVDDEEGKNRELFLDPLGVRIHQRQQESKGDRTMMLELSR